MINIKQTGQLSSSFRDPSGFLFSEADKIYRQINQSYKDNYDLFIKSNLYKVLVEKKLLIPHKEVDLKKTDTNFYKTIKPDRIDFISYPYEWSFSQLKKAALTTLEIQKESLKLGMSLKDCSAYNIQWHNGQATFIDTLSFEKYKEGNAWVAYKQFCQHFLAPLALMSYCDVRLNKLLRVFIDGLPLDLTSKLLPAKTRFRFSILSHIHLHAKSQQRYADKKINKLPKVSKFALLSLINSLENAIKNLKWKAKGTEWGEYYTFTNYSDDSFQQKKNIISNFLNNIKSKSVWDAGGNTGEFSRIASDMGIKTVSFDIDEVAVEKNYLQTIKNKETNILPLVIDLTNPSAAIGWQSTERMSLIERGPVDTILALALVHHLAISNNLPFGKIADFFSKIGDSLIIEFVPKGDSQVQKLLTTREDIFGNYNEDNFIKEFSKYFSNIKAEHIKGSKRTLYLMTK